MFRSPHVQLLCTSQIVGEFEAVPIPFLLCPFSVFIFPFLTTLGRIGAGFSACFDAGGGAVSWF